MGVRRVATLKDALAVKLVDIVGLVVGSTEKLYFTLYCRAIHALLNGT